MKRSCSRRWSLSSRDPTGRGLSIILALLLITTAAAEPLRVPITRDTWVSTDHAEQEGNNGGAPKLKTKGIQEFTLFDIDPVSLRGRVVTDAVLHMHAVSPEIQRRLTVSTLAAEWGEGTSSGYQPQAGGASFLSPVGDMSKPWAYPGSDLTAAMNGLGNTLWRSDAATPPDAQGWQSVAVDPRVLAARVAGVSGGFVLFDDIGSEYQRNGEKFTHLPFLNRFISSREDGPAKAPYLTVTLGDADDQPPEAVAFAAVTAGDRADLRPGEALIRWTTPRDRGPAGVIGFLARYSPKPDADWDHASPVPQYLIPMAGASGAAVTLRLRDVPLEPDADVWVGVRAVDAAGNAGPVAATRVRTAPAAPDLKLPEAVAVFSGNGANPRLGDAEVYVIDPLDKLHPLTGELIPAHAAGYTRANHLWSAAEKTVRLFAARNEFVAFQVAVNGPVRGLRVELRLDTPTASVRMLKFRHVTSKRGPLPDPLLPLDVLDVPAGDERLVGQTCASFLVDLYLPHDTAAGVHHGTLTLSAGDQSLTLNVELRVWNFTLPDRLSFIPEMNCYSLPAGEVAYYRVAQEHRVCLNRLPYNWAGHPNGPAPGWDGRQFDWQKFDARCGPLLDGSAFRDLPRGPVPVETFYLPLNENWPMSIDRGFTGGYWPDDALTPAYRAELVEASRQFAEHFAQRGWNHTLAEFFLNGKVYYKKEGGWSRCSSPWIFDEPVNTQDFAALRWYGRAFHEGVGAARAALGGASGPRMAFRCDISRPQWQRDMLDGVVDVDVIGGPFRHYTRMLQDRKETTGETPFNYGGSNKIEDANTQPAVWCVDAWRLGADGVLPWQTIGKAESWQRADPQALFYPVAGPQKKGVSSAPVQVAPSIRLKAYLRGQQDVEYLTMLVKSRRVPRWVVAQEVQRELGLAGEFHQAGEDDAGVVAFKDPEAAVKLWRLRTRVGAALDQPEAGN